MDLERLFSGYAVIFLVLSVGLDTENVGSSILAVAAIIYWLLYNMDWRK